MTKVPSLPYTAIVSAFQRDGWVIVRRKGSHIRMEKKVGEKRLKIIVPVHKPVKRSTLWRTSSNRPVLRRKIFCAFCGKHA